MASLSCRIIATTLPIPVSWPAKSEEEFTAELDADIQLTWYAPECRNCETQGGFCGLKRNSREEIDCFHLPPSSKGRAGEGLKVFGIICLSIAVPALAFAIGIVGVAHCLDDRRRAGINSMHQNNSPAAVLPQPTVAVTGLDESTIESHEKLVLGDSRRIPGPNDGT
ncbi:Arabidopsis Toxicos en Levadura 96 [Hibiscus trionum]|uniref:RING-type E3 ubiquitin transferase n=1 Tax=Hibiscus trionum TaxID=183268 RepID=A0A9W7IMT8_HIBTR|nr:Arabidopsis Toxicos en Levadura 96 [Hibiscus trionum]